MIADAVLDSAPDPADARRRAERFAEAARAAGRDPGALPDDAARVVGLACARAPYLATLMIRDPDRLWRVCEEGFLHREKPVDVLTAQVREAARGAASPDELAAALRRVRGDEMVRLGVRELELGLDTEVGRELSRLAGACFDAAIAFHEAALRRRYGAPRHDGDAHGVASMVVIGMGKLGGEELNFSSDVDVIYVYSSDAGAAGPLSLHEYFAKLAAAVTASISEVTSDDIVFRVDLRLRPEGSQGAIANSHAQLERYYETFGRPWERQAWLKARPCAGDLALGAEIMETMRPFVFPRHTAPTVVDEVKDLNRRIKRELVAPRGGGFDVKNGVGGIREIEFFVQALQLIHARNPGLRARGTLATLDQLLFAGLVKDDEHLVLWRAYRWLRHVEHLLQLESGRQTQRVPADVGPRTLVAKRLGYRDVAGFDADLARHTHAVARIFATLDTAPASAAEPDNDVAALLAGQLAPDAEHALLARLGFRDPTSSAAELSRARRRPDSPLGGAAGSLARLGPALVAELAAAADPDQALRYVVDLAARRAAAWSVWRLLDESRPLLRLLVSILGASEYLAKSLIDRPELIDLLIAVGSTPPSRTRAELETDCDNRLLVARVADPDDEELAWSALAEFKNGQVLRVALADFAGRLAPLEVCAELTRVAEVCLDRALALVEAGMRERHGVARTADGARSTMAVLALGKLGGGELGYAADLDVVFVFGGDGVSDGARPIDNVEYWTRAAQRLMHGLHARTPRGKLYDVDTRLRPSGSKGLLVSSLAAWRRYHENEAQAWEHQALTKLRAVVGDPEVGRAAARIAIDSVWGRAPDPARVATAVADMRDRIERELGKPGDLKTGKGGVVDVEFAAQCVALAFGHAHPELRAPATVDVLAHGARLGVIAPSDAALLADGYRFLRLVEHRLRIVHDRAVHRLPDDPVELEKLARRCGFPDGASLSARAARWRDDIRAAFTRVIARAGSRASP